MISNINSLLADISNWVNAISLLISIATLITMLRFKHKLKVELEKEKFSRQKRRIVRELRGYAESLCGNDEFYQVKFLLKIDLYLVDIKTNYTFWSRKLSRQIDETSQYINKTCLAELKVGNTNHRHDLTRRLQRISVLIEKE